MYNIVVEEIRSKTLNFGGRDPFFFSAFFFTFYTNSQCFLTILIKKLKRAPESPFSNFEYGCDYAVVTVGHYYKTAVALTVFWTVCFASIYHTRGPIKILTKLDFVFFSKLSIKLRCRSKF